MTKTTIHSHTMFLYQFSTRITWPAEINTLLSQLILLLLRECTGTAADHRNSASEDAGLRNAQ